MRRAHATLTIVALFFGALTPFLSYAGFFSLWIAVPCGFLSLPFGIVAVRRCGRPRQVPAWLHLTYFATAALWGVVIGTFLTTVVLGWDLIPLHVAATSAVMIELYLVPLAVFTWPGGHRIVSRFTAAALVVAMPLLVILTLLITPGALGATARAGQLSAVRLLLAIGHDPNSRDKFGSTPLIKAVASGDHDAVAALLARGANPNLADNGGETPLSLADRLNFPAIAEQLRAAETLR